MLSIAFALVVDMLHFIGLGLRSHARLAAENLFPRKQLALYLEREAKPRRASNATRLTLVVLARFIEWRTALTIVQPDTLGGAVTPFDCSGAGNLGIGDARGFRGMCSNSSPTWRGRTARGGEERIAELLMELGLSLSPRTVRRYMRRPSTASPRARTQT